jgi:hypothetical protein
MTLEHWVFDARDSPPARTRDLPAIRGSISALLATPSWPPCAVIIKEILCVPSTFSLGLPLPHPHFSVRQHQLPSPSSSSRRQS